LTTISASAVIHAVVVSPSSGRRHANVTVSVSASGIASKRDSSGPWLVRERSSNHSAVRTWRTNDGYERARAALGEEW
jgi:hypothetical protein